MTHANAVRDRRGLEPSDCPGRLALIGHHEEDSPTAHPERVVCVYQCRACGVRIALAHRYDPRDMSYASAYEVLNVYRVPEPDRLVEDLARQWRPAE
jgi:hypothetical protein